MSEVVIVGGGVIGLAIAWRAALGGLSVTVVDPSPGQGASWAAAGMLAPVSEVQYGEHALLSLNLASAERYPSFVAELEEATGLDVGYRTCGTLVVALDGDDKAILDELQAFQLRLGLKSEQVTGRECRRLEPMLDPGVRAVEGGAVGPPVAGDRRLRLAERDQGETQDRKKKHREQRQGQRGSRLRRHPSPDRLNDPHWCILHLPRDFAAGPTR